MISFLLRCAAILLSAWLAGPAWAGNECPPAPPQVDAPRIAQLKAQARDRGPLWRVEKDGRVSWLYGTMHVGREEWLVPGPRITQALLASDTLAVEIDPGDMAAIRAALPAAGEQRALPPALLQQLDDALEKVCAPAAQVKRMTPMLQVIVLALLEARREGLFAEFGIDPVLVGFARGAGKKVVGLETPASQVAALGKLPQQDEMLASSLKAIDDGETRTMLRELAIIWSAGDTERLLNFGDWCAKCIDSPAQQEMLEQLSDKRNGPMADKLARLHEEGTRFFAAVGMLHMPGPQGIAQLLTARGFKVERVPFESKP